MGTMAGRAGRLARAEVEARAVQPALEGAAVELALGQRDVGVGAGVVDAVHVAVGGVHDGDPAPLDLGQGGAHGRQLVEPADPHEARCRSTWLAHAAPAPASSRSMAAIRCSCTSGTPIRPTTLGEEPAHDEAAGLVLGDAARHQVEQLLVVEPACRGGVPGTLDLAGLDLEVGHRVGARALGEHQVAVELVGVGALGARADEHVADPHGVGGVALQRALVLDVGRGSAVPRGRRTAGARGAGRHRRSRRRGPRTTPPGPVYVALVLNRTMPPPIVTAMCRTGRRDRRAASCWARWWASSSHSCTVTRVTCAPSPATTESDARCSRTCRCARARRWRWRTGRPARAGGRARSRARCR